MTEESLETPSGKGSGDENFPVGSFLLPRRLRPHVATYYAFARAVDDIADNPELSPNEKIARLERMSAVARGDAPDSPEAQKATLVRKSFASLGITTRHATDLCIAFKQDAVKARYADWAELMGYCENSANPVGRFLLDLHGEERAAYRYSDALCSALQVLNHLQDLKDDYRNLNRIYLPQDWMVEFGAANEELGAPASSKALRAVQLRCLAATDRLVSEAELLPPALKSWRLAMESAVIVKIAHSLSRELKRRDPLAGRVALTRLQYVACALRGLAEVLAERLGISWRRTPGAERQAR